jgi:Domain of unknown function (DUF1707)
VDEARPDLRASDNDRERVAARLRQHCAQGQLTISELDERIARAYGARTHGDLLALTRDLPVERYPLPVPERGVETVEPPARTWLTPGVANWLAIALLVLVVWALTLLPDGFWPKWPIGVGAAAAAGGWIRQEAHHRRRRR